MYSGNTNNIPIENEFNVSMIIINGYGLIPMDPSLSLSNRLNEFDIGNLMYDEHVRMNSYFGVKYYIKYM